MSGDSPDNATAGAVPRSLPIGLRSRTATYGVILGIVIGMLIAGLAVPLVFGKTPSQVSANAAGAARERAGGDALTTTADQTAVTDASGADAAGGAAGTPGQTPFGGSSAGTVARGGLTASDRGVTATSIKVAVMLVDLGTVSKLGVNIPGLDPKEQQAVYDAFINYLNSQGGVLGRKLAPVYITFDPIDQDSMTAACVKATEDEKVFAAFDVGLNGSGQLCFTEQHQTPLIDLGSQGVPVGFFERSNGLLFTLFESGVRGLQNLADTLVARGALKGKRIGILDDKQPGNAETVTAGFVNTLKELGYQVEYRADLDADGNTAASQMPVVVNQMCNVHHVDTVFLLENFLLSSSFVQQADSQGCRPHYIVGDWQAMANDISLTVMPASFAGTAITTFRSGEWRVGKPEPAPDAACRQLYAKQTGKDVQRSDGTSYQSMTTTCGMVDLFARAARAVGPNLTRQALSAAFQRLGGHPLPGFGGASYGPQKFDGADPIRTMKSDNGCSCWLPADDFRTARY